MGYCCYFLIGHKPANPNYNVVPGLTKDVNPGTCHTWLMFSQ